MEEIIAFFLSAFVALFVIVNPLSTASVFLTITRRDSKKKKFQMAKRATIAAAIVLIIFTLVGNYILGFFSITVDAFKIAGGFIIFGVGWSMLKGQREYLGMGEKQHAIDKSDISIIPLAIPMLSGPGAITTSIVLSGQASGSLGIISILLAAVLVCLISFFVLTKADFVDNKLGESGRRVLDRIMGLLVVVVGVQFVINGIVGVMSLI